MSTSGTSGRSQPTAQQATYAPAALAWSALWIAVLSAVIAYGSLLPFSFEANTLTTDGGPRLSRLTWQRPTLEDAALNLWLYVPLGAALALAWPRGLSRAASCRATTVRPDLGPSVPRSLGPYLPSCLPDPPGGVVPSCLLRALVPACLPVAAGAALGFTLSLAIEWLQTAMPARVGSWIDVALNTVGSGFGAAIGVRCTSVVLRGLESVARHLAANPFMTLAAALTLAMMLYVATPFDFLTSTFELHAAFRRVRWQAAPETVLGSAQNAVNAALYAVWFALIGFCVARGRIRDGWTRGAALASAVKHGVLVALLVQLLRLMQPTTFAELWAPAWYGLTTALGATIGMRNSRFGMRNADGRTSIPHSAFRIPHSRNAPRAGLLALGVLLGLAQMARAAHGLGLIHGPGSAAGAGILPFEGLRQLPAQHLLAALASDALTYGLLTVCVVIAARRWLKGTAWFMGVLTTTAVAVVVELLRVAGPARPADFTGAIVAAVVSASTAAVLHRWHRLLDSARVPTAS